jgi:hypothetical protein
LEAIKNRLIIQYPIGDKRYDEQVEIAESALQHLEELVLRKELNLKSLKLPVIK